MIQFAEITSPCKGEVGAQHRVGIGMVKFDRTRVKTARARSPRKQMTGAESRLWSALRGNKLDGFSFRRQHPVGPYVLDFYCPSALLCIELDGGHHAELVTAVKDHARSAYLAERGIEVMRFWNNDVRDNAEGVLEMIRLRLAEINSGGLTPTPTLPLAGGGSSDEVDR